jgi:antirestriction protein ArdC
MAKGIQRDNLYCDITAKIIAELERGIVPWVQPWTSISQLCPLASHQRPHPPPLFRHQYPVVVVCP